MTTTDKYSELLESANKYNLPSNVVVGLIRYITARIETGSFLRAILENDLKQACLRADDRNRRQLYDIVDFIYHNAPYECWGSSEAVTYWLRGTNEQAAT